MTETTLQSALWTPGWYELDQTLVLGERQKYWFFQNPPPLSGDGASAAPVDLVFYNQLDSTKNCCVRYAKIVEISHPQFGPLLRIDTDGLDYIFYPVEGEEIIVNAEEDPGKIFDGDDVTAVSDWSVAVKLTEVSEPMGELA